MISVIIPTYNAGMYLPQLLTRLAEQTLAHELIIIDSDSKDNTQAVLKERNISFHKISSASFNHGGTRNLAISLAKHETIIMLTQDAIPANSEALETLVNSLNSRDDIAMAYGRQLPYPEAGVLSQFARQTNYPAISRIKAWKDIPELGIRTCHCSNSFAAYRKSALLAVGGFPNDTVLGEDVVVAARLITNGRSLAYCADAKVFHSHDYSLQEEFKRYFDIGAFHQQQQALLAPFTRAESEGLRYVLQEWKYLSKNQHLGLIPAQIIRTGAKFIGYRLGKWQNHLPVSIKRKLSMHAAFWKD
jgi:rhamnosyltransferase